MGAQECSHWFHATQQHAQWQAAWSGSIQDCQTSGNQAQGKRVIAINYPPYSSGAAKVGHITCDNASNNPTMMKEFAAQLKATTGKRYNWKKRKIKYVGLHTFQSHFLTRSSCLAHVINLATQMLVSTYSKSPHFDPKQPEAHVPTCRDEVGLIRAIVVKVHVCTPKTSNAAHA